MALCGIQSLTVLLCLVLILSTGAIIGGFTLTTWDDLVEKAREAGNEGFGKCLVGGVTDIEIVSSRYLRSVLGNVDTAVKEYLKVPEQLIVSLATLAQAHHPNASTSPAFGEAIMNPALLSAYKAANPLDMYFIGHEAYAWCQAHPVPWQEGNGVFSGWGSYVAYNFVTSASGVVPPDYDPVPLVFQSVHPSTLEPGMSDFSVSSESDSLGRIKESELTRPCNTLPRYALGESRGICISKRSRIEPPAMTATRGRQLHYLHDGDPPLNPADELVYRPMQAFWDYTAWDLSYTYTHPEMYMMYPKQGKRVGAVSSVVTANGLLAVVRNQMLPEDSSLYLVEESSDAVGLVVAYNKGRHITKRHVYFPAPMDRVVGLAVTINITNHSMEDATLHIPSVIAEHGRFVFTHPRNYRDLVEKTEDSFLKWSDSNGTEYWTMTSAMNHKTLLWYANLLVPRESVMNSLDTFAMTAIRAKVAEALATADAQKEDAVIVMVILVSVAVIGLLAIAVVFTRYITSPLLELGSEMASVAVMDLEAVDTKRAVSQLSEVRIMQRSFVTMVANLVEYRNYMPQSVFVNDSDEYASFVTESTHRSSTTTSSGHSPSRAGSSGEFPHHKDLRVEGLKMKNVSLVHMNVVSWHAFCENLKDADILAAHARVIETIMMAVLLHKGVCDTFAGDKMLAAFNAFVPNSSHRISCVKAAHKAETALSDVQKISYGCTTGEARVGNMGCTGMKKVSIVSECMSWVVVLERWNRMNELSGVLDQGMSYGLEVQVVMRCEGAVLYDKVSENAQVVYAVKGLLTMKNEEWMYQLEAIAQSNPHSLWNAAFEHIIRQEFDQASALLDTVGQELRGEYAPLLRYVQEQAYAPFVVSMY